MTIQHMSEPFVAVVTPRRVETRPVRTGTGAYVVSKGVAVRRPGQLARIAPMVATDAVRRHMAAAVFGGEPVPVVACWCSGLLKILAPAPAGALAEEADSRTGDDATRWRHYRRLQMHIDRTEAGWRRDDVAAAAA